MIDEITLENHFHYCYNITRKFTQIITTFEYIIEGAIIHAQINSIQISVFGCLLFIILKSLLLQVSMAFHNNSIVH